MTFNRNFLPLSQFNEIEQSVNKDIAHIKDLALQSKEEDDYYSDWLSYISDEHLKPLFDDPNPYSKVSRKISLKQGKEYPRLSLTKILTDIFPNHEIHQSGCFYYPKNGFMGWHTNHDKSEDRLYITFAEEDKQSFFRYYKDGNIITDYDNKGITIRRFSIPSEPPYFWHCVGSHTDRFSFGYRLTPSSKKI